MKQGRSKCEEGKKRIDGAEGVCRKLKNNEKQIQQQKLTKKLTLDVVLSDFSPSEDEKMFVYESCLILQDENF